MKKRASQTSYLAEAKSIRMLRPTQRKSFGRTEASFVSYLSQQSNLKWIICHEKARCTNVVFTWWYCYSSLNYSDQQTSKGFPHIESWFTGLSYRKSRQNLRMKHVSIYKYFTLEIMPSMYSYFSAFRGFFWRCKITRCLSLLSECCWNAYLSKSLCNKLINSFHELCPAHGTTVT